MPLHGQFFRQQDEIKTVSSLSSHWLENSFLRFETESIICAAQEQALATNHIQAKIWKNGTVGKCRLCREQDETVNHIISGCKMLAATKYLYQHNLISTYLHWCLAKDMGVGVTPSWLMHRPKILWHMTILTDSRVLANRPDIIYHDTRKNIIVI